MRPVFRLALLLALPLLAAAAEPLLALKSGEQSLTLTAAEFAALPHTGLTATDPHAKVERHFAGVPLRTLVERLDAPLGPKLRGAAQQMVVLVRSNDDYIVVFSLADLDEGFGNRTILLADGDEDGPLPATVGPLRLVVPGDKFAARWVRQVTAIELLTVGPVRAKPHSH